MAAFRNGEQDIPLSSHSTLLSFRKVIASHLASALNRPSSESDTFLPLVQQNTGLRRPSHSVFSVVIKRLVGGREDLDEAALEKCLIVSDPEMQGWIARVRRTKDMLLFDPVPLRLIQLTVKSMVDGVENGVTSSSSSSPLTLEDRGMESAGSGAAVVGNKRDRATSAAARHIVIVHGSRIQDPENGFCALRRTVLTSCVARFLKDASQGPVKVIADENSVDSMDSHIKGLYRGLELISKATSSTSGTGSETILDTIKTIFQTNSLVQAHLKEDGSWVVDLTSQKLGHVKVFAASTPDGLMTEPTVVTQTLITMALQFSEHECGRYVWMVPDARRQVAEQVLFLARTIFSDKEAERRIKKSKQPESSLSSSSSWAGSVEVLYFGHVTGVDIWEKNKELSTGLSGVLEYTNARMKEVVVENRGRPGRGVEYDGDDGDEDESQEEPALDEAELARMTQILSESALAFASVSGKRIRKLHVDMSKITDGKGNSGVFLQYVHSRLCGIERKSNARFNSDADLSLVEVYPESLNLCLVIAEWHDILVTLQKTLDPYVLVSYLFRLAAEIGQANRVLRVKDMETVVAEARWLLFWSAKRVLEQGLTLLGLEFVERM